MANHVYEKKINNSTVKVSTFPGRRGLNISFRLMQGVGPAVAGIFAAMKKKKDSGLLDAEISDFDAAGILKSVEYLMAELDPDKSIPLIMDLLELTWIDGQQATEKFDSIFQENYGLLTKTLAFVVEVNFKTFLPAKGVRDILSQAVNA